MADPFTALGTASSILTLVEFTWKLLTNTYTTYKSTTGGDDSNRILSLIAEDVTRFAEAISMAHDCEDGLRELVEEARSISRELLEVLEKLQVRGIKTAWKSFVVTLNELWQSSEVKTLSERLIKLQNAIIFHMQKLLLNNVSGIPRKIVELERTSVQLGTKLQVEFHQLRQDLSAAVCKLQRKDSSYQEMEENLRRWNGAASLDDASIPDALVDLQDLFMKASHLHEAGKSTEDDQRVLRSLYFNGIMARHKNIAEAHARTFAWIFQREPPGFVYWLENSDGIFWIEGKPGSGKSTLMKFLSNHDSTRIHLRSWAQDKELVLSRFSFWNAGSPLQKSQEGLLRSLLFGILRNCPHLVPRVSAIRMELRDELDNDWSWIVEDLLVVLCKVIEECKDTKFCFFIDGMDEQDENKTELTNLIKSIQILASLPNLKLCVSSRPWSTFADAFGQNPELTLKVEDLTRDDIRQYISDKFEENKQFARLRDTDPTALGLVEEICQRAKGVFLWVYLVVRDLLVGFTNGDSAKFLKTRLERFPADLDGFFRQMLDTIPSIYLPSTARIFKIAVTALEPQFAVTFSFIDDIENDPEFVNNMASEDMSLLELQRRHDEVRRRLDARTKGLLEVTSYDETRDGSYLRVDFLHRTVRDFLVHEDGLGSFISQYGDNTNDALIMCDAIRATLKKPPLNTTGMASPATSRLFQHLFHWAAQAEQDTEASTALISILCSVETMFREPASSDENLLPTQNDQSFLGLACEWGILSYVKTRINYTGTRAILDGPRRPLLDYALNKSHSDINLKLIETLLNNGADPNQEYEHETACIRYLHRIKKEDLENNADIESCIKLLIGHGAALSWLEYPGDCVGIDEEVLQIIKQNASKIPTGYTAPPAVDPKLKKPMGSKIHRLKNTLHSLMCMI
ncbi:hypothetical protein Daesc_003017 [Daldinia eschscholtzii]|uniref:NACHT domain-containing protein n=1 Tax=Daldinia eschscholtzii TaxID=292717 RepID=A0AAX6MT73_9PEZI